MWSYLTQGCFFLQNVSTVSSILQWEKKKTGFSHNATWIDIAEKRTRCMVQMSLNGCKCALTMFKVSVWNRSGFNKSGRLTAAPAATSAVCLKPSTPGIQAWRWRDFIRFFWFKDDIDTGTKYIKTDSGPVATPLHLTASTVQTNLFSTQCHLRDRLCFPQTKLMTLGAPSSTMWRKIRCTSHGRSRRPPTGWSSSTRSTTRDTETRRWRDALVTLSFH